jgi:hypothetical protein
VSETNGDISLAGTALALKVASENLKLRYQNTPLAITLAASLIDKTTLDVTKCTVKGWGGTTTVVGSLSSPQQRPLRIDLSASDLAITALLETFKPDLSGRVSGTITSFSTKLATAGPSSDLATALQGPGSLRVTNGVIKGTNLAAAVLAKVDSLPFLAGSLRSFVPPQFDKQFSKPDTEVRDLRADFSLRKGALGIGSFSLTSDIFSLDGDGSVAFTGEVNLKTTIYFTKEFSQALAQQGRDVKNVLAADGRLIIPLTIQGRSPALVLYPNIQKIIETGAAKALQDKALSALEKALGGKSKKEGGTDQKGGQNNLGKALRGLGL